MVLENVRIGEGFPTLMAGEGTIVGVGAFMPHSTTVVDIGALAVAARKVPVSGVHYLVAFQLAGGEESGRANSSTGIVISNTYNSIIMKTAMLFILLALKGPYAAVFTQVAIKRGLSRNVFPALVTKEYCERGFGPLFELHCALGTTAALAPLRYEWLVFLLLRYGHLLDGPLQVGLVAGIQMIDAVVISIAVAQTLQLNHHFHGSGWQHGLDRFKISWATTCTTANTAQAGR